MKNLSIYLITLIVLFIGQSCDDGIDFIEKKTTFSYSIHDGEVVASAPYDGEHPTNFSAVIGLIKNENGTTEIIVTLRNTIEDAIYEVRAYDATSSSSTPYEGSPNDKIFSATIIGNGESVSHSEIASLTYEELVDEESGFFVVHDPLQELSTTDISTNLVLGPFAKEQIGDLMGVVYDYAFNVGQVDTSFAYTGDHSASITAEVQVDELAGGNSRISVRLFGTIDGEMYPTHVHDKADAASTPNGTPYVENPNADVFAAMISGNGGMASYTNISSLSFENLTTIYRGFFVVHDPLQDVSTTDPTSFVLLGDFARMPM